MIDQTLESWIWPHSPPEFREHVWQKRPSFVPGEPGRLARLEQALGPFRLQDLLARGVEPVRAWYVDQGVPDYSLVVPIDTAYRLYRAGLTIYFDLRDDLFGTASLSRALADALGHPREAAGRLSIFATRRDNRTLAHVDQNENFTVQLTGHKRWGFIESSQLDSRAAEPAPMQRAELTPGAVLYMPGPWLHETEDLADSISLNLSLSPPPRSS